MERCSAGSAPFNPYPNSQGESSSCAAAAQLLVVLLLSYGVNSGPLVSAGCPAFRVSTSFATASLGCKPTAPNHFCSSSCSGEPPPFQNSCKRGG